MAPTDEIGEAVTPAAGSASRDPAPGRLPDFVIGGAMKAGTTTLHQLLARHAGVFIPEREIHFFCLDDITEHPDFAAPMGGKWVLPDFEADLAANLGWYRSFFGSARPDQLVGEHSTVYLPSSKAPERIARILPEARLVFLLRDPVARAWSHYWHRVRRGRAVHGFEATLRYAPHTLLTRGFYRRQLEAFFEHIPRERIKVLIFEELIREPQRVLDSVTTFLGLRPNLDLSGVGTHFHRGDAVRFPRLQLLQNRLFRPLVTRAHRPDLPGMPAARLGAPERLALKLDAGLRAINRTGAGLPAMQSRTQEFLAALFARENAGLSELLGIDLERFWPSLRPAGSGTHA
jgi:hypothetical protein